MHSAFSGNCSVSCLSFVFWKSLWVELNVGENPLHWKANMLPLISNMTVWLYLHWRRKDEVYTARNFRNNKLYCDSQIQLFKLHFSLLGFLAVWTAASLLLKGSATIPPLPTLHTTAIHLCKGVCDFLVLVWNKTTMRLANLEGYQTGEENCVQIRSISHSQLKNVMFIKKNSNTFPSFYYSKFMLCTIWKTCIIRLLLLHIN